MAADWHEDGADDENCFEADRMPLADGFTDAFSGTNNEVLPAIRIVEVLLKGDRGDGMDGNDDDDDDADTEEEKDCETVAVISARTRKSAAKTSSWFVA